MGNSIGSTHKDIRFYLDKLVEKFPNMFGATIVDRNISVVTSTFRKFEKDLLKWRWKQIRKEATGK
jgi:hypothetical protein